MPFRVPRFPLRYNLWRFPYNFVLPPDQTGVCQLRSGRWVHHGAIDNEGSPIGFYEPKKVLFPKGEDLRSNEWGHTPDYVEIPAGSLRFYVLASVDDVAKGFSNEYRYALVITAIPIGPAPVPLP